MKNSLTREKASVQGGKGLLVRFSSMPWIEGCVQEDHEPSWNRCCTACRFEVSDPRGPSLTDTSEMPEAGPAILGNMRDHILRTPITGATTYRKTVCLHFCPQWYPGLRQNHSLLELRSGVLTGCHVIPRLRKQVCWAQHHFPAWTSYHLHGLLQLLQDWTIAHLETPFQFRIWSRVQYQGAEE
jgi:hypothetical protein